MTYHCVVDIILQLVQRLLQELDDSGQLILEKTLKVLPVRAAVLAILDRNREKLRWAPGNHKDGIADAELLARKVMANAQDLDSVVLQIEVWIAEFVLLCLEI